MTGKVLSFYLKGKMLGLDINLVKEISRRFEYSHVPDSNPHIVGLMNLRGQVVTLFDLGQMLGLSNVTGNENQNNYTACIILKAPSSNPDQVGFLIDESGDVFDIQQEWCEKTPANVKEINGEYISEVVKLNNQLLLILDTAQVFEL